MTATIVTKYLINKIILIIKSWQFMKMLCMTVTIATIDLLSRFKIGQYIKRRIKDRDIEIERQREKVKKTGIMVHTCSALQIKMSITFYEGIRIAYSQLERHFLP